MIESTRKITRLDADVEMDFHWRNIIPYNLNKLFPPFRQSNSSPFLLHALLHFRCNPVQPRYQNMEVMDTVDKLYDPFESVD